MEKAIRLWSAEHAIDSETATFLRERLKKHTTYGQLLLFPPHIFCGPDWKDALLDITPAQLTSLCTHIARAEKVTNIAINKPIPLQTSESFSSSTISDLTTPADNILRAPINFTPLFGTFGPATISTSQPTNQDFDDAFWTTTTQNGIAQTWAPRWTMFSRGNVREKARLLGLESVAKAVREGEAEDVGVGMGCAAVDLYVGIGYFAFSYLQAGVGVVLGWDLNGWSLEGLRRGAVANGWGVVVVEEGEGENLEREVVEEKRLVVFHETNEKAPERVEKMRGWIPPVRHVNCGMLPSSRESLALAAAVLDARFEGWVHVHENFAVEEVATKAEATQQEFEAQLLMKRGVRVKTDIEQIFRLKSYAPGVVHCVIDIRVNPTDPT